MILFVWEKKNFQFVVLTCNFLFYSVDKCIQQLAEMKKKKLDIHTWL